MRMLVALLLLAPVAACTQPDPKPTLLSYYQARKDYADALDEAITGRNPRLKIAQINAGDYQIGTLVDTNYANPFNDACAAIAAKFIKNFDVASLPNVSKKTGFEAKADVPLINRLVTDAKFNANVNFGTEATLGYGSPTMKLLYEDDLDTVLADPACRDAVRGRKLAFVRGVIRAAENNTVKATQKAGAQGTVPNAVDITVSFDNSGTATVAEKDPKAHFFVISTIEVQPSAQPVASASVTRAVLAPSAVAEALKSELSKTQLLALKRAPAPDLQLAVTRPDSETVKEVTQATSKKPAN